MVSSGGVDGGVAGGTGGILFHGAEARRSGLEGRAVS